MTEVIEVRGLRCLATIGVLPFERERPQEVTFDLDVHRPLLAAGAADDLAATTNYADVLARVVTVASERSRDLLETLALDVARALLALDESVARVTVAVRKADPPVEESVSAVGVRITVDRES